MVLYYKEPIAIVEGDGRRVKDVEGREYLDFFGGILTTMTGYNVPEVVSAIKAQADKMLHTSTLYLIESQIELAEKIAELSGIPDAKVFFTNSGTEANDAALMIATQYRRSNQVLAVRGSYHGKSHSTVAITGWRASAALRFLRAEASSRGAFAGLGAGARAAVVVSGAGSRARVTAVFTGYPSASGRGSHRSDGGRRPCRANEDRYARNRVRAGAGPGRACRAG